jgi:hypothetical protein
MFAKKMFLALSIFSSFLHEFCLRVLSFASEKNFNIGRESILTESCRGEGGGSERKRQLMGEIMAKE